MTRLTHGTSRFALFSETLLTGVVLFVLCLPLVTILPALAAGVAHLRRHLEGRPDTLGRLWADYLTAIRTGGWLVTLSVLALLGLLGFNISLALSGALPGGQVVAVATAVLALVVVVVALRAASRWPGLGQWAPALTRSAHLLRADPTGAVLVTSAVGLCAVMVWMLLPLLFLVPGLLALALMAVDHRPAARTDHRRWSRLIE